MKNTTYSIKHSQRFTYLLSMFFTILFLLTGMVLNSWAEQSQSFRRIFAYEYTNESMQWITFTNISDRPNIIIVNIYEPDGSPAATEFISLVGYETITIIPKNDWGLRKKSDCGNCGHGHPWVDCAYGIVATAQEKFVIQTYSDEQEHGGSGVSAIWPQNITTETWWGMYNYDNGYDRKKEYFYINNAFDNPVSANVAVYASNGTPLDEKTFTLDAHQTIKVYPRVDFPTINSKNIGLHLTSSKGVGVSVYSHLGSLWKFPDNRYTTNAYLSGLFVPWNIECLLSEYAWVEGNSSGKQLSAARVTNPHNFPITVTIGLPQLNTKNTKHLLINY